MLLKTVRSVNRLLVGTLSGNEFGTWAAVHPAVEELSPAERLRAEQALTRRFGAIMPAWMGAALASSFAAALLSRGSAGFRSTLFGALCFAAMLASTRLGNVPINDRTLELKEDDVEEFGRMRDRWGRLHTLRVALTTVGLAALVSGACGRWAMKKTGRMLFEARAASALGAAAVGAAAFGAVAIGALAIRTLAVKRGKIGRLSIDELEVGRLRVRELVVEHQSQEEGG